MYSDKLFLQFFFGNNKTVLANLLKYVDIKIAECIYLLLQSR